jgi:hypothetical protein
MEIDQFQSREPSFDIISKNEITGWLLTLAPDTRERKANLEASSA